MITIDDREHALIARLQASGTPHEVKRLLVADVLLRDPVSPTDVRLAIERKTVDDLRASLADGRFAEQRSRMVECYGVERCVYIIEGVCTESETGVLTSLQFRDRLIVVRTADVGETKHMVVKLAALAEEGRLDARQRPPEAFAKVRRMPTSDPKLALRTFLCAIQGVSKQTATIVSDRFDGPGHLCAVVTASGIEELKTIVCGQRKLGPVVAQRIADAFAL